MIGYWAIFRARFLSLLQYRAAAVTGVLVQLFWGGMRVMIFTAFYRSGVTEGTLSLTLEEVISYIWLCQVLLRVIPWHADKEIEKLFRDGNVAYEMVRPVDLYWGWFLRAAALRMVPVLLQGIPLFLAARAFFGLEGPADIRNAIGFGVAFLGACLLSAAYTTLLTIVAFWTVSSAGISKLMPHLVSLLSGLVIPLPLFPEWAQGFLYYQPFRGIFDTPLRIYLGDIDSFSGPLLHQILWIILLICAGRRLLIYAKNRLIVQGG